MRACPPSPERRQPYGTNTLTRNHKTCLLRLLDMAGSRLSLTEKHPQKHTGARFTKGTEVMQNGAEVMCAFMLTKH